MTDLGKPLVVLQATEACDGGQCGGEITLWTDLGHSAYALVESERGRRYIGGDCDLILRKANGDIEVTCASVDLGDNTCDGKAVFTRESLSAGTWHDPVAIRMDYLKPMDRE